MEKIVLRDVDSGKRLEVRASRPNTYENLNEDEMHRVRVASRWKDRTRTSDQTYSSLSKVGDFPRASHVKQYEREINEKLPEIKPVRNKYRGGT